MTLVNSSSCDLERFEEVKAVKAAAQTPELCPALPLSAFVKKKFTFTISPKDTTVPLAVTSEVGGGLNGGNPVGASPVIVNT